MDKLECVNEREREREREREILVYIVQVNAKFFKERHNRLPPGACGRVKGGVPVAVFGRWVTTPCDQLLQ